MQAATTTTTDPEQRPSTSEMQQQQHSGLGALQQSKLMQEFLTSGVSVASGTVVTNPIGEICLCLLQVQTPHTIAH